MASSRGRRRESTGAMPTTRILVNLMLPTSGAFQEDSSVVDWQPERKPRRSAAETAKTRTGALFIGCEKYVAGLISGRCTADLDVADNLRPRSCCRARVRWPLGLDAFGPGTKTWL